MTNTTSLVPMNEVKEMAVQACKSGLFSMPNESAAFTLMMVCQAEGLHPIQALRRYHIIHGRPSMRADAMLAEFHRAGGKVSWKKRTDKEVSAVFSHDEGGKIEVSWTIEMAKKANLTGSKTWQQYPRQMLTARVISEGVRTIYPAVVTGIYTPEEVQDFGAKPIQEMAKTNESTIKNEEKEIVDAEYAQEPVPEVPENKLKATNKQESKPEAAAETIPETLMDGAKVAEQLKRIRVLSIKSGCKTPAEAKAKIESIIGRQVSSSTNLNQREREQVIAFFENNTQQEKAA